MPTTRTTNPFSRRLALVAVAAIVPIAVPAAALLGPAPPVGADPVGIVVDELIDELNADGDCSLREAVETVNSGMAVDACVPGDPGLILLPADSVALDDQLVFTTSATLEGTNFYDAEIDCGTIAVACLQATGPGAELTVRELMVNHGGSTQLHAGALAGTLRMERAVSLNAGGAGVLSEAPPIELVDSIVSTSQTNGVLAVAGPVHLTGTVIAGSGQSGVDSISGDITVEASTILNNDAFGLDSNTGTITVRRSLLHGNAFDATRTVDGRLFYESATVVANRRALNITGSGAASFRNTVVADSAIQNCDNPITTLGFNVSDDDTCGFDQETDRNELDPELANLGGDEALLPHLAPLPGSPLIDTGGDCGAADQIDQVRPTDGDGDGEARCDVGAIEVPGVPALPEPDGSDDGSDDGSSTTSSTTPTDRDPIVVGTPRFTG